MSNGILNRYGKRREKNKPVRVKTITVIGRRFKYNEFDYVLVDRLYKRMKRTAADPRAGNDLKEFASSMLMQVKLLYSEMKKAETENEGI